MPSLIYMQYIAICKTRKLQLHKISTFKHVVILLIFLVTSRNTWKETSEFALIVLRGRLNNGLLKISMLESPGPVNKLPYITKGTLLMRLL